MAEPLPVNPNPLLEDTFLGSPWFNPDYLFNRGVEFFNNAFNYTKNSEGQILSIYHTILFVFALFFLTIISYSAIRLLEIRRKEHKHLHHELEEYAHHQAEKQKKSEQGGAISKNERWLKTLDYLFSQHASDWKLAIVEADAMLEALLAQLGFKGDTLGDKLKSASQESFKNLSAAWEVHNIRNKIAHDGASFNLTQREAKRLIALYEQIFRGYGYI